MPCGLAWATGMAVRYRNSLLMINKYCAIVQTPKPADGRSSSDQRNSKLLGPSDVPGRKRSRDNNVTRWRRGFLRLSRQRIFFSQPCRQSQTRIQCLKSVPSPSSTRPLRTDTSLSSPFSSSPLSVLNSVGDRSANRWGQKVYLYWKIRHPPPPVFPNNKSLTTQKD